MKLRIPFFFVALSLSCITGPPLTAPPEEVPVVQPSSAEEAAPRAEIAESFEIAEEFVTVTHPVAFRQISWMMIDAEPGSIEYRVLVDEQRWSPWRPAEISFQEGDSYNARVLLRRPTTEIQLRGGEELQRAHFAISERITARPVGEGRPHCPDGEAECREQQSVQKAFRIQEPALPIGAVTGRHEWGAIDPDRFCSFDTKPHRVSFHHTFMPGHDGEDPARRIRQIQAFHINERGWCDIGYHFLIAQNGEIFRGRKSTLSPGAHVRGHNAGNIGIGFIGDFMAAPPAREQLEAAARLTRWLHESYEIPLNRESVRGHHEWPGQQTGCPGEMMHYEGIDAISQILDLAHDITWPQEPLFDDEPAMDPMALLEELDQLAEPTL